MLVKPFASPVYPARSVLTNTEEHFLEVLKLGPGIASAGMYRSEFVPRSVTCHVHKFAAKAGHTVSYGGELSCSNPAQVELIKQTTAELQTYHNVAIAHDSGVS